MSTHAIPDPDDAVDRVLRELGRARWREGLIRAVDAHTAVCNALYGRDAAGEPCPCGDDGDAA